MKIVIPMTGYGSRFVAAGYVPLKPWIPVLGMPILQWIVEKMYPGEQDFLFICRASHLKDDPAMEDRLRALAPHGKIAAIDDWVKKGPVFDVLRASGHIEDDVPCIINYCDFYMNWDWKTFCKQVTQGGYDGSIPCYTGFHPHLLPQNNQYASCKTGSGDLLLEIREKYSFETDKMKALHSPGVYYFKTGRQMKKYCEQLVKEGPDINGEYYASLVYNGMVCDGLKIWVPCNVNYFCQWGTPEDLNEFLYWVSLTKEWER